MKKFKLSIIGLSAILCMLSVNIAWGATSSNTATIGWGSPASGNISTTSSNFAKSRSRVAGLWNPNGVSFTEHYVSPGSNTDDSSASGTNASASGQTRSSYLRAISSATAITPGDIYSAESTAERGQGYLVGTGGGLISFSLDYLFDQSVDPTGGDAYGYTQAWCDLLTFDGTDWVTAVSAVWADGESTTFGFDYTAIAGENLYFRAGVGSVSSAAASMNEVPVPGAIWLLGSGLLSLLGIRKK